MKNLVGYDSILDRFSKDLRIRNEPKKEIVSEKDSTSQTCRKRSDDYNPKRNEES